MLKKIKNDEVSPKLFTFVPTCLVRQQATHSFSFFFIRFSRVFRFLPGDFFYSCKSMWMRNVVFLPVDLIKEADEKGWLRTLAYFVRLKSLYKNNTHYNFTLRSLGAKIKCSPTALSAHMKIMCEKGLIAYHGRNVTFRGLRKLNEMYDKRAKNIGIPVDHKNQYDILRGQIIRFNLSAQEYNIRKSGRQIQRFGNVPSNYLEKTQSCYTGLSAEGVGGLFGLTAATGSRIRKKLAKMGLLRLKRMYSVLFDNVPLEYFIYLKYTGQIPIYSKYRGRNIIRERRNSIQYIGAES